MSVYGDAQKEGKAAFLAELSKLYQDNPLPCVIGGDFYIIEIVQIKVNQVGLIILVLFLML